MQDFLAVGEAAARAGGRILLEMQGQIKVREKSPRDLVTEADLASQEAIRQILLDAFPDHQFLGEEDSPDGHDSAPSSERFRWIVDPLDGTTNYVHQLQTFSVSIALERQGEIEAGVVFDPIMNDCYSATAGGGAFLNGEKLAASKCSRLGDALIAASLPAAISRDSALIPQLIELLYDCRAVRRLGSAALNMCYVAAGRLDGYWAPSIKIWDIAAGLLIVREAGGSVSDLEGGSLDLERPQLLAAATSDLIHQFVNVLKRAPTPEPG